MMGFIRRNSYYVFVLILILVVLLPTYLLGIDKLFFLFYKINATSINNTLMTVFSILFAFMFTIMTILFSLREDSYFFNLLKQHPRYKQDIVNYFIFSIIPSGILLSISLFLTITYVGDVAISNSVLSIAIKKLSFFSESLVRTIVFFLEIAMVNLFLLIISFISILKKD